MIHAAAGGQSGHQAVDLGLLECAGPIRAHRFPRVAPRGAHPLFADHDAFHCVNYADRGGEHGARDGADVTTRRAIRCRHLNPRFV
jgi:hypothetical protein